MGMVASKSKLNIFFAFDIFIMEVAQGHNFNLEQEEDILKFYETYKNQLRTNQNLYIEACNAMIFCEQEEESKTFAPYNRIVCLEEKREVRDKITFLILITDELQEICDAMDNGLLESFDLHGFNIKYPGRLIMHDTQFIRIMVFGKEAATVSEGSYKMIFTVNSRASFIQKSALETLRKHGLFKILINNEKFNSYAPVEPDRSMEINPQTFKTRLNKEQNQAVDNIVNKKSYPLPYILYGPPGTGKTQTLVAAIQRIVTTTNENVLVCANSNAVCDEIAGRLIGVLDKKIILRFYPESYDIKKLKKEIQKVSNTYLDEFPMPPLTFMYKFRVVVCTLYMSSYLNEACNDKEKFNARHFSHIIIDENASTHETMTLIPIAGLCTSENEIHSSIVLAGDPKQLNAVTKSRTASKIGHNISFMENLFKKPLYQRDPETNKFNPDYITMLVKNYRSHPKILDVPNKLFYDNALRAAAKRSITDWFIGSQILPSKKIPIIFQSVRDVCKRDREGSLYNGKEGTAVIEIIKKLLDRNIKLESKRIISQTDIGVVTPYKAQCRQITQSCRVLKFNKITIGTAEIFQGQEKPIMIVSTVRCGTQGLGFVHDKRRMNVIITRAKCLLVIVGDPDTLSSDPNWKELVDYCKKNKALI